MQFYWSESEQRNREDSCESLAPFVMALFDGEASEEEAKRARVHLLVCQSCAHRWLDWNRSKDLLMSVSVPAPPPTLMWRVLMACRVASYSRKAPASNLVVSNREFEAVGLGTPGALRAQILARTTRVAAYSDAAPSRVSKKRTSYVLPSLAVPAMALFLMVSQRDQLFSGQMPEPESYQSKTVVSPEREIVRPRVQRVERHHALAVRKLRVNHVSAVKPDVREAQYSADERESAPVEERAARPVQPRFDQPHFDQARFERSERSDERESKVTRVALRDDSSSEDQAPDSVERTVELRSHVNVVAPPRPTVPVEVGRPIVAPSFSSGPVRPASLSDKRRTPGLRTASWELTTSKVSHLVDSASSETQSMRLAVPSTKVVAPVRPVVSVAPPKLLAENFDTDDSRVDEVRSVVDDFRASLQSPTSSESEFDLGSN